MFLRVRVPTHAMAECNCSPEAAHSQYFDFGVKAPWPYAGPLQFTGMLRPLPVSRHVYRANNEKQAAVLIILVTRVDTHAQNATTALNLPIPSSKILG